jgi:hypothetical protein
MADVAGEVEVSDVIETQDNFIILVEPMLK